MGLYKGYSIHAGSHLRMERPIALPQIWARRAWNDSLGAAFYVLTTVLAMFHLAAWFDTSWIRSMSARGEAITLGLSVGVVSVLSRQMRS